MSKVREAYMGPTWGRQDPGGPHVGTMNLVIRDVYVAGSWHVSSCKTGKMHLALMRTMAADVLGLR